MNIFNKRPLLLSLFLFVFCATIAVAIPNTFKLYIAFSFLILIFVFLCMVILLRLSKKKWCRAMLTSLMCLCFAAIAFYSSYSLFERLEHAEALGEETEVVATIEECTFSSLYMTVYTANIKSIDGKKNNFKASITSLDGEYFEVGETIVADMFFSPFTVTDYGFDERTSNISNGILASASFSKYKTLGTSLTPTVLFNKLRAYLAEIIDDNFTDTGKIIKALLIGDKSDIDAVIKSNFSRLGISHILSISGTHFSVLLGMLAVLLSLLGFNKKLIYAILIPTALFYIGLSGFSFSVCRAGIMALITYWGFLCGRQKDCYTALFASVFVILLLSPYAILSISLWLSFIATFTILIVLELLSGKFPDKTSAWYKKFLWFIFVHIIITLSIAFSTLPIISIYFGAVSLASPIANLIIVPLFEIYLYIIPFAVILSNFSVPVYIAEIYGIKLLELVEELASIDNLMIAVNQPFVLIIACIGIFATLILIATPVKKKFIIAIPAIISFVAVSIGLLIFYEDRYDETYVSYFNTGKSDAVVLTDTNRTMCIDVTAGTSSAMYYTKAVVNNHYATAISAYIFTHYRSDHIKAFEKLAARLKIKKVYLPNAKEGKSAEYMQSVAEVVDKFKIDIEYFEYGVPFEFEQCLITVFEPQFISRTSHEIISFYVSTYKDDLLYLGSSFTDGNFDYSKYISDAEYIIFGQHYPKIKNKFNVETDAKLIFGNEEIFSMSNIENNGTVLNNGEQYNFMLK